MYKIQDLFDPAKQLNREIESVVTFGEKSEKSLSDEIKEYVVTDKLHQNYEEVIEDLQRAFDDSSKEVGIWVSGFYGSGKSSFAKYLGLSFDTSILINGVTFGQMLMSRIQDTALAAMHRTIIARHNPAVVMIDLSSQNTAGKFPPVSDIVYYETLKLLGITKSTDQKVMCFVDMLHDEGKYDEFCRIVEEEKHKKWADVETNDLAANMIAASLAPRLLPAYFPDSASYRNMNINSALNEKERFIRLYNLVKEKTGKDKIIFVLDEVGQYVASNVDYILNVQGMMQIFKDEFHGKVWVIATAQQTLTEDNRQAQLNSNELFRLNDRFPVKVDIEANDIKEIITKRLLGKSKEGKDYLRNLFKQNEGVLKNGTHLTLQARSIYNQVLSEDSFADLYPFLPVHIDILLSLLQKLASRTGGVGLRSVIRLIRDILVDNHLADATIGTLAGPEHFYDVLRTDMERNAAKEIVIAAEKAIRMYNGNALAVRICKTIAIMQLLDDFNLSFDNICALLYNKVGEQVDKGEVREILDEISQAPGLTLQEAEGKYQFMTNAILGIREERDKIIPREADKAEVMQQMLQDILTPAPSVNVYNSKTVTAGVELTERNHPYSIYSSQTLKMNVRFVDGASFEGTRQLLLTESTRPENKRTLYWLCTLNKDKESLLQEIVKSQNIRKRHQNETNKEIQTYLRAQGDLVEEKKQQLRHILRDAQANSEIIFRGTPQQVNADTYKTQALKGIAEKIFEKYPMAPASMKADCVTKLGAFDDLATLPDSLNPLKIIDKSNGTINIKHPAISEIKDFIASKNEVIGSEVVAYFEDTPYGWSKDTIRYLVALMLKASIIQIRVAGKDITVFGETAVNAMATNNSFNKINISLNTEGMLTVPELLEAIKNLTSLFNSPRIAPVKDQIAKEAYKKIKFLLPRFNNLVPTFEALNLAGLPILKRAISYANRIMESEGGEAAYLLGKDSECVKAFKYVMDILKSDKQSGILGRLKHINHLTKEADTLSKIEQVGEFMKRVNEVCQIFNEYVANPDLHTIASDIIDLSNQFDSYLQQACIDFQAVSNKQLDAEREAIISSADFSKLSEEEQKQMQIKLSCLMIESRGSSIENLREMVNEYSQLYVPGGSISTIKSGIRRMAESHAPTVTVVASGGSATDSSANSGASTVSTSAGNGNLSGDSPANRNSTATPTAHEPTSSTLHIKIKRQLKNRAELQDMIDRLTELLDKIGDDSPVELDF